MKQFWTSIEKIQYFVRGRYTSKPLYCNVDYYFFAIFFIDKRFLNINFRVSVSTFFNKLTETSTTKLNSSTHHLALVA